MLSALVVEDVLRKQGRSWVAASLAVLMQVVVEAQEAQLEEM